MADFIPFFASIDTGFSVEHIKGAFCYIVENFEDFFVNLRPRKCVESDMSCKHSVSSRSVP